MPLARSAQLAGSGSPPWLGMDVAVAPFRLAFPPNPPCSGARRREQRHGRAVKQGEVLTGGSVMAVRPVTVVPGCPTFCRTASSRPSRHVSTGCRPAAVRGQQNSSIARLDWGR